MPKKRYHRFLMSMPQDLFASLERKRGGRQRNEYVRSELYKVLIGNE